MTDPPDARRPAPVLTADNHMFWEAARNERLVAQKCAFCGRLRHPPRPMCPHCHALEWELVDMKGSGTVYSYSLLHHPQNSAFDYPIVAALIDLDEGIRVVSNLVEIAPEDVKIGLEVTVAYIPTKHDGLVPVFKPKEIDRD